MTKIKLCGLTRPCDIAYANALKPEFVGFVFVPGSKRFVTHAQAAELRKELQNGIAPVGVFADASAAEIQALVEAQVISAVQLHGGETSDDIRALRRMVNCPIIQAVRVSHARDIEKANASAADEILLDAGGGSGTQFPHALLAGVRRRFFLAGGLNSENVRRAIEKYRPYAVDASSWLETDGKKDYDKMAAFVNAVRNRKDVGI